MNVSQLCHLIWLAAKELDEPTLSTSKRADLIAELLAQRVTCSMSDPKRSIGVDNVLRDEAALLEGKVPATSTELLDRLHQLLDNADLSNSVVFRGEDERVYVASVGVNISLATPDLVADLDVAVCDICSYVSNGEHEPSHITDLIQRVAPGEPFPAGQCPECGALMHPMEQHD